METVFAAEQRARWLSRPLCRRYRVGIFDVTLVALAGSDGARKQTIHWALGCLRSGEWELLGAWVRSETVFVDLQIRGIEGIQCLVGHDRSNFGATTAEQELLRAG